ncbi:MAG TPA: DUF2956 family protein [Crenotrichaceae bacterium]|nr:DUF2956 family protein [Crenotrichaceae bacterium]
MLKKNQTDKQISFEAQAAQAIKDEAEKIANATQAPGQTKSETKLIAKGIAKGIETYKKQEKAKARERSRNEKRKRHSDEISINQPQIPSKPASAGLARLIKYFSNFMAILSFAHFSAIFIPKQTLENGIQWVPIVAVSLGIFYLLAALMFLKISNKLRGKNA